MGLGIYFINYELTIRKQVSSIEYQVSSIK
jgi:hypothetical protein